MWGEVDRNQHQVTWEAASVRKRKEAIGGEGS